MRLIKAERKMLHIVEQRIVKSSYRLEKFKRELHQTSVNFKKIARTNFSCAQLNIAKQKLKEALQNLHSAKYYVMLHTTLVLIAYLWTKEYI